MSEVQPVGSWLLVEPEDQGVTVGGIYLPRQGGDVAKVRGVGRRSELGGHILNQRVVFDPGQAKSAGPGNEHLKLIPTEAVRAVLASKEN